MDNFENFGNMIAELKNIKNIILKFLVFNKNLEKNCIYVHYKI
jgi:hypothetical protein